MSTEYDFKPQDCLDEKANELLLRLQEAQTSYLQAAQDVWTYLLDQFEQSTRQAVQSYTETLNISATE